MFLHVGENIYIYKDDIVAILDKNVLDNSKQDNVFVQNLIEEGCLVNNNLKDLDDTKTYIIACNKRNHKKNRGLKKEYKLYVSNISSTTLLKRNKDIAIRMEV
ncbi:DUF370 domain-containing protein [Schnuerera sp. xch1]|uniref:DUF370 domain-containing protein n=1 Tax=Schnuerera sp. xch1 TaxID=2874283 RepID=UPI001CBC1245|nr:DUF370 domain-containing protein [Schnuerera sp. xch1]MBZ2175704.1 DUF370 domain-containing protein [Schnuerera sp. xch1]